ncbi:pantoate--beta-alanine ligase [Listeria sp. PSOL-1]|uniref:pantoate--beta-alanine ligase n=1 Tax=Listeria sp. PSOL-1 TaxID=1844999 RepID=UPI0013D3CEEB|nr:pantoate--beta-alanine ligase [Listeria sp. PSOL-1]
MRMVRTKAELKEALQKVSDLEIGFVPTMGYLHEGHLALVKAAKNENDYVVMSIFVNPKQFGPNEDFACYPRDEAEDSLQAERAGVDLLFLPTVNEMYPQELSVQLHVEKRIDVLDGSARPGHFDGVVTVLLKLFSLMMPTRAYFGQKDAQQVAIVESFVADYFLPIEIRKVATIREKDGLAKSSRNVRLSEAERRDAAKLHQALLLGRKRIEEGHLDEQKVYQVVKDRLLGTANQIDYLTLLDYPSFLAASARSKALILAIAVKYKQTRLIDNEIIPLKSK